MLSRGKRAYRSTRPFLRTMAFLGCEPGVCVTVLLLVLFRNGVAYGGDFLERAASQSNGIDEEMEGVAAGDL